VSPSEVAEILSRYRFNYTDETLLQVGISEALKRAGVKFQREVILGDDGRIDFLIAGGTGVEVKTQGSPSELVGQLHRYAGNPNVTGLLLVTGRSSLAAGLPKTISQKPLVVLALWRSVL
jgi:hypothetical protein